MIIRNGVRHNTSNFGGSGNANIVKLTQSEYDALPESKKSDGILYAITDGECSASGGSSKPVELTKAEYEALGDKVNSDGILYAITDGDGLSAKNMAFDDTETQLGVNNVQDAIVEQNKNFGNYVGFPNYSKVLNDTSLKSKGASYTATENCWVIGLISQTESGTSANIFVDNVLVCSTRNTTGNMLTEINAMIPVKKGSVVTTRSDYGNYNLIVYATV